MMNWLRRLAQATTNDDLMMLAPLGLASAAVAVTALDVLIRTI